MPRSRAPLTPTIRSAVLAGFPSLCREFGIDCLSLLEAANLPAACLAEPDRRIPVVNLGNLLAAAARCSEVDTFGLRLSESIHMNRLGLLALAVYGETTVGSAIEVASRYAHLHNEALRLWIEREGQSRGNVVIREEYLFGGQVSPKQLVEMTMGVIFRNTSAIAGHARLATRVCFRHAVPKELSEYRHLFGVPVEFDADFDGIVCSAESLLGPNRLSDRTAAAAIKSYLDNDRLPDRDDTPDRVRRLIWGLLPSGKCTVNRVASQMNIDRRTLCRRLGSHDLTYIGLVNEIREELATRHVDLSNRSLTEIADLLGFSSSANFSRWFQARFSRTASSMRKARALPMKPGKL